MSSTYGTNLKLTLFGESHGAGIGCVLDGFPAGCRPDFEGISSFMARRAPGSTPGSTARREADTPEIVSGIFDGRTTGSPITALIRNADHHSSDYADLAAVPRPGHADFTLAVKTGGANDVRGGGHSSGRLTAGLCFAGGLAMQYLESRGIHVASRIASIGGRDVEDETDAAGLDATARETIENARSEGDSVGGVVECTVTGFPAGYGDPMFHGVDNRFAAILFGIPAVKGVEFGNGFAAAALRGSANNDAWIIEDGRVLAKTNRHGGLLGGMTTGMPLVLRVAIKPTPSIALEQDTVSLSAMEPAKLAVRGRHDPCIVPRAVPVVEAVVATVLLDALLDASATFADGDIHVRPFATRRGASCRTGPVGV